MTIRSVFSSSSFCSCSLAACTALVLLACEREHVSVGTLPCSDDERVLCEPHARDVVVPNVQRVGSDSEAVARIVWEYDLPNCATFPCDGRANDYLVHDDGELTLAAVRDDGTRRELWVAWLDPDSGHVFETGIPGSSAWLGSDHVTGLDLQRDAQGDVLLFVGRGRGSNAGESRGTLRAYAIARSGEITQSFEVDTAETWPGQVTVLDTDLVIARTTLAPNVELSRHLRRGDMRWRQTQIARLPDIAEIGLSVDDDTRTELRALTVDRRGRIWGTLFEGVPGLVQVDPNGFVGWHALVPTGLNMPGELLPMPIAIDSRDRPIIGFAETVLRFEPDGTEQERLMPLGSSGLQEQFYPQTVRGLAVDAQDRVYVATEDGSRSQHRLLIERIAEDFRLRERFVLPLDSDDTVSRQLNGLQLGSDGDVYVRIVGNPTGLSGPNGTPIDFGSARVARVRLGE